MIMRANGTMCTGSLGRKEAVPPVAGFVRLIGLLLGTQPLIMALARRTGLEIVL
jgi:hypothetical protein